jgi:hypothetical protein
MHLLTARIPAAVQKCPALSSQQHKFVQNNVDDENLKYRQYQRAERTKGQNKSEKEAQRTERGKREDQDTLT